MLITLVFRVRSNFTETANFAIENSLIEKLPYGYVCFLDQSTQLEISTRLLRGLAHT